MRLARLQRDEALLENSDRRVAARQPDQAARLTPQRFRIDNAARLIVVNAVPPLAGLHVITLIVTEAHGRDVIVHQQLLVLLQDVLLEAWRQR